MTNGFGSAKDNRRVLLAAKAVLAPVWGVVAYAVRVYLTLLVEPQINPIKHFPVVTVAAKLMLPFALTLDRRRRRAA